MLEKRNRSGVLIAGMLFPTIFQGAAPGQTSPAAAEHKLRTWTDRSGQHHTEAAFVALQGGKVTLKKKDGATLTVPLESLSDADREFVKQKTSRDNSSSAAEETSPAAQAAPRAGLPQQGRKANEAEINPARGKQSPAISQAKEVIAAGVGADPEKAVQNAFSQAIQQTVGLLVDSETVVKNDELIRDEVLTYSRGYVEKYEVVKQWQEDGLHHVSIRAVVARDKLAQKTQRNEDCRA